MEKLQASPGVVIDSAPIPNDKIAVEVIGIITTKKFQYTLKKSNRIKKLENRKLMKKIRRESDFLCKF